MPQQKQQPVDLTSHGRISRSVCSHVTPEVFFGACVDGEDEEVGERAEHQMVMKSGPRASFKMVEPKVVFGALEILLDVPSAAAEGQALRFGGWSMQVSQIVMIRFGGIGWPVDHQPEFFEFAPGLSQRVLQPNLPPSQP